MNYPNAIYVDQDDDDDEYENENGPIGGVAPIIGPNISNQNNNNRKVITLGDYDPKYEHRAIGSGLNFQGKCQNPACKVNGLMVWWNLGYGSKQFAEEIFQCKCRICKVELEAQTITNIGYRYAKVKFTGRKKVGLKNEAVVFQDEEKEGKLIKFMGGNKDNTVEWIYLRIDVEKI